MHADSVSDEVRRVLAENNAFAERVFPERAHAIEHLRGRVGPGHELEELHVANGVEKVHDEKAPSKHLRPPGHQLADAQAARVRGHYAAVCSEAFELLVKGSLRLDLLDDGLDHQIPITQQLEVVLHSAHRHQTTAALLKEHGRLP